MAKANNKPSRKKARTAVVLNNITHAVSQSRIPPDNLSYSVLLSVNESRSTGSGFRMKYKGSNYLVTAKHVLYDPRDNLYGTSLVMTCHSPDQNSVVSWIYQIDLEQATIVRSASHDLAAVLIGHNEPLEGYDHDTPLPRSADSKKRGTALILESYVNCAQNGDGGIVSLDTEAVGKLNDVSLANDVYLMGYPTSLGIRNNEFYDFTKPLVRKGIVAGIYAAKSTFVIDCPAYPGNSGGPVVENSVDGYFRVIGVVSKYIPYETKWHSNRGDITNVDIANSGYTVCSSMDAVLTMLADRHKP